MAHEDFVTYEQAEKLKELGFNWKCYAFYDEGTLDEGLDCYNRATFENCNKWRDNLCSAPTLAQAQRWLRERFGRDLVISPRFNSETGERIGYFWKCSQRTDLNISILKTHNTYEEALSEAITTILDQYNYGEQ